MAPKTRTAVVVDDSSSIRKLIGRMLVREGFEVIECFSGALGLAAIAENEVALATIDLALPDTNGLELLGRILKLSPATQVLVITGHATSSFVPLVLAAGAFDVLYKPFDLATIQDALRRAGLVTS